MLKRLRIDPYIITLLGTVALASVLPARGGFAVVAEWATAFAIGLLFFLYGARLAPQAALAGARQWRLHGAVLIATFVLFPVLGLGFAVLVPRVISPDIYTGILFLCALPSTVQSSIAFTSIARGNVAAAICAASASNMLGILLTPLLASLLLGAHVAISPRAIGDIVAQLLLPFAAGQLLRPWIATWVATHKRLLNPVDRGSILLVVYTAFSAGVVAGIWHRLTAADLVALLAANVALLAAVLAITTYAARALGFSREDEIVLVFCGSKKSLASGLPMATVLFSAATAGLVVVPLMLFHQIQLIACAALARRYAAKQPGPVLSPNATLSAPR